jgi:hypothetical protein
VLCLVHGALLTGLVGLLALLKVLSAPLLTLPEFLVVLVLEQLQVVLRVARRLNIVGLKL